MSKIAKSIWWNLCRQHTLENREKMLPKTPIFLSKMPLRSKNVHILNV